MKPIVIEEYQLQSGAHTSREDGMCAMEFVSYLAGEPHSDKPSCVSPLITSFIISCNDNWTNKERQLLKPYLTKVMGTRDGKDLERPKIFAMHALTRISPHAIELIGLKEHAEKMRTAQNLDEGIVAAEYAEYAAKSAAKSAEYAAKYAKYAEYAAKSAESQRLVPTRKAIIQSCLDLIDAVILKD